MTLQQLLDALARWADLNEQERNDLNAALPAFVAECSDTDELAQLDEALVAAADSVLDAEGNPTDDGLELLQWVAPQVTAVRERGQVLATAEAEATQEARNLLEAIHGPAASTDGDGEGDGGDDGEQDGGEGDQAEGGDGSDDEEAGASTGAEQEAVAASGRRPAPRITRVVPQATSRVAARNRARATTARPAQAPIAPLVASANTAGVDGVQAGHPITMEQLGAVFAETIEMLGTVNRNVTSALPVRLAGRRADLRSLNPERFLTMDSRENMRKIHAVNSPAAIAAAGGFCMPFPVNYDVPGVGSQDRPVRETLVRFGADRGGMRYVEPPKLADLEGSNTIWTAENDAAPGSDGPSTKPVLVVECGEELTAQVYAIPQALEFRNWTSQFFMEWQERYLALAAVHQARTAENKLLEIIAAGSKQVSIGEGLSATRDILAGIDRIIANRRYVFRLSDTTVLQRIAPIWERDMIRTDLARELPGSTDERLAVADAKIDEFFDVRNIENTYHLDGEAGQRWAEQGNGPAQGWPGTIVSYLFQAGEWLFLDGGENNVGVVRDQDLVRRNAWQLHVETFEGAAPTGMWSSRVVHDVCPSGATSGTIDFNPCAFGS